MITSKGIDAIRVRKLSQLNMNFIFEGALIRPEKYSQRRIMQTRKSKTSITYNVPSEMFKMSEIVIKRKSKPFVIIQCKIYELVNHFQSISGIDTIFVIIR
jgi:hypothetical protein